MKQFINQPGIGTACMDDLEDISMYIQCKESQQNNFTDNYAVSFHNFKNSLYLQSKETFTDAEPPFLPYTLINFRGKPSFTK